VRKKSLPLGGCVEQRQFNDVTFVRDMSAARLADGGQISFTRQERSVLIELSKRAGQLVMRDLLHTAIAGESSGSSIRRIDFLINRLRQKLGDDARNPRFIATQYGEGYIWVAEAPAETGSGSMIAVGRLRRPDYLAAESASIVEALQLRLAALPLAHVQGRSHFEIEIGLAGEARAVHGAFAIHHVATGQVLGTLRRSIDPTDPSPVMQDVAEWAQDAIWQHLAAPALAGLEGPGTVPVELHLHSASLALWREGDAAREAERHLSRARLAQPDNAAAAILWGLSVYHRMVNWPPSEMIFDAGYRERCLATLGKTIPRFADELTDRPLLKLGAAKLLWMAGRQYMSLAERMAEEAFAQSTAFAAAQATRAQIAMLKGETAFALELFEQAIALADYGSLFHIYLLVLKAKTYCAAGDRRRLRSTLDELFVVHPEARPISIMFMLDEDAPLAPNLEERLLGMSAAEARAILVFLYQSNARWLLLPEHQANVMRGPVRHFRNLHGPEVIPHDIAAIFVPAPR
jgi:DNA-binding winged helix-turn-helix (wHTH) protein/tetratricopeptide (TPR) repeat protein